MSGVNFAGLAEAIRQWVIAGTTLAEAQVVWADGRPRPAGAHVAIEYIGERDYGDDHQTKRRNPHTFTPFAAHFLAATNAGTAVAHGRESGDGPVQLGGAVPAPLANAVDYWIIKVDDDAIKLATSLANASVGAAIDVTADGNATVAATADTLRVGEEVEQISEGDRVVELRVQAFSPDPFGAIQILSDLRARSQLPDVDDILDAVNYAVANIEPTSHVPIIRGKTSYESRAACSVALNTTSAVSQFKGMIAAVTGSVSIPPSVEVPFRAPPE